MHLYLRHSGIKLRDSKVFPGLSSEKEKWLAFLKTKKVSGTLIKPPEQKAGLDGKDVSQIDTRLRWTAPLLLADGYVCFVGR